MRKITHLMVSVFLALVCTVRFAPAQSVTTDTNADFTPIITGSTTGEKVRFAGPPEVVQLRLDVLSDTGQVVFGAQAKGNVLDWSYREGTGVRLQDGTYLCLVRAKTQSGQVSQRIGSLQLKGLQIDLEWDTSAGVTSKSSSVIPLAFAAGTEGRLAKWTDNAGTLGDSAITEANGNIGVGNTSPQSLLHIGPSAGYGTTTGLLVGNFLQGAQFDRSLQVAPLQTASPSTNSILLYAVPTVLGGVNVPNQYGIYVDGKQGAGTVQKSAAIGTGQNPSLGANNNTHLLMGTGTIPTGNFSIYDATGFNSIFSGNMGIGTVAPSARLDVAGNINTSTQYNIGGNRVFSIAGSNNTFAGSNAGNSNTTGSQNSFVGSNAGQANTTASNNAFFGASAGQANTTGASNSFFGRSAGSSNTTGFSNAFFGESAGNANTTGQQNSFFGGSAGLSNTTGVSNSFFGHQAGFSNTTGNNNALFGQGAGRSNTTAGGNSFFGAFAGTSNTTGDNNSFFGFLTGSQNTTGAGNSFFGSSAGSGNTTGSNNSFFGYRAGDHNTTGIRNSFFGKDAGFNSTTGSDNSFFGNLAGVVNTMGANNAFFGTTAGGSNTTGNANSFFGESAAAANSTGSGNVVIGSSAGRNLITGSNNIYLANVGADESNRIRIGTQGTQTATFIAGISGTPVVGDAVFVDANGQLGVGAPSSRRFKQDIGAMGNASSKLMQLRPVVFHYRPEYVTGKPMPQYGLIAEEVAKVYPELVGYGVDGKPQTVRYHLLNALLLNEVQKQERHIQTQKQQLQMQAKELADLEARLRRLEAQGTRRRRSRR